MVLLAARVKKMCADVILFPLSFLPSQWEWFAFKLFFCFTLIFLPVCFVFCEQLFLHFISLSVRPYHHLFAKFRNFHVSVSLLLLVLHFFVSWPSFFLLCVINLAIVNFPSLLIETLSRFNVLPLALATPMPPGLTRPVLWEPLVVASLFTTAPRSPRDPSVEVVVKFLLVSLTFAPPTMPAFPRDRRPFLVPMVETNAPVAFVSASSAPSWSKNNATSRDLWRSPRRPRPRSKQPV